MTIQRLAIRLYRLTLYLYPSVHRCEWGEVMVATFEDMCLDVYNRSGTLGLIHLWLRTLGDTFATATQERLEQYGRKPTMTTLTNIQGYQIESTIHSDGGATFYLVRDSKGQSATLKLYDESHDAGMTYREFARLSVITHPVAPKLLAEGKHGKQSYCIMEPLDGQSWLMQVEAGGVRIADVVNTAIQICDFLTYLHGQNPPLIHRGIKPLNIIRLVDGVRLLDYELMEDYAPKQDYPKIGTEGYSPPEQYAGQSDPRSDIYALGASLYHVLTGRDPRKSAPFLFYFHPPRSLNSDISEVLEAVILKAVEHKPQDRFESAQAMKSALEKCR